jgi:hypothetical protein
MIIDIKTDFFRRKNSISERIKKLEKISSNLPNNSTVSKKELTELIKKNRAILRRYDHNLDKAKQMTSDTSFQINLKG